MCHLLRKLSNRKWISQLKLMIQVLTIQGKMRVYLTKLGTIFLHFFALIDITVLLVTFYICFINEFFFKIYFQKEIFSLSKISHSPLFMPPHFLAFLPILKNFLYPSPDGYFWEVPFIPKLKEWVCRLKLKYNIMRKIMVFVNCFTSRGVHHIF